MWSGMALGTVQRMGLGLALHRTAYLLVSLHICAFTGFWFKFNNARLHVARPEDFYNHAFCVQSLKTEYSKS